MKQLILGATIGVVAGLLLGGGSVYAAQYVYELPWTKNIYNISRYDVTDGGVSVFDDGDNKCYVARVGGLGKIGSSLAISCVKRGDR